MKLLYDYFYRFPRERLHIPGRCRVRIYKRKNGAHTVVLTELSNNSGESITSACDRIATHLAAAKELNPKTTRWIHHDLPEEDLSQDDLRHNGPPHNGLSDEDITYVFDELQFTWDSHNTARDPQWQDLEDAKVEELTGASLSELNRRLENLGLRSEGGNEHEPTEAKSTA